MRLNYYNLWNKKFQYKKDCALEGRFRRPQLIVVGCIKWPICTEVNHAMAMRDMFCIQELSFILGTSEHHIQLSHIWCLTASLVSQIILLKRGIAHAFTYSQLYKCNTTIPKTKKWFLIEVGPFDDNSILYTFGQMKKSLRLLQGSHNMHAILVLRDL